MYRIAYAADYVEDRSRLKTFFRIILVIPWLIVGFFYYIAAALLAIVAWFAIVFTGRYPDGLYRFNAGFLRFYARVNGYYLLLTDAWPPFEGGEAPDYPIRLGVAEPLPAYNRWKTGFRIIVGIPVIFLSYIQSLIQHAIGIAIWVTVVILGRLPEGIFRPMHAASAYEARATGYFLLLTEDYLPFWQDRPDPIGEPSPEPSVPPAAPREEGLGEPPPAGGPAG